MKLFINLIKIVQILWQFLSQAHIEVRSQSLTISYNDIYFAMDKDKIRLLSHRDFILDNKRFITNLFKVQKNVSSEEVNILLSYCKYKQSLSDMSSFYKRTSTKKSYEEL